MSTPGRILIVDDDRDFVDAYQELLASQGVEVGVAHTAEDALRALEADGAQLDLVLLDQKLQGPGGPDTGLELIARVQGLAPFAKTIVVTGYASPAAIERAFEAGVYDYLVKNGAFEALLRAKVRNALEVGSERRAAARSRDELARGLRAQWEAARGERDRNRKGKLLEELVKDLFRATPGFERVRTNLSNELEQIDVDVENCSDDPLWRNDGAVYLLGECKNWSSHCGARELRDFLGKLTAKYCRARTGFFIAPGGFTKPFHEELARRAEGEVLVIPIDGTALEHWIDAADKAALLRELHRDATFGRAR